MLDLFERISGYAMLIAVFAVAYHFTDSFAIVALIAIAFYFITSMLGMVGVVIQALTWIAGAVFVIVDEYHIISVVVYFVLFILYIVRMVKVIRAAKRGEL